MSTTYAIPTLGNNLYLSDPSTALTYLVRTYSIVPTNTVPILADKILSLSQRAAELGAHPDKLASVVISDLTQLLSRNFPTGTPDVLVTYETQPNGWYTLIMSATIQINGQIYQADYRHTIANNVVVLPNDQVSFI